MNHEKLKRMILWLFIGSLTTVYAGNEPDGGGADSYDDCGGSGGADSGCIEFWFPTGPMKNQINLPPGKLTVMSELPSPTVSTPQAIKVVTGLYGIEQVTKKDIVIYDNKARRITFEFPNDNGAAVTNPDTGITTNSPSTGPITPGTFFRDGSTGLPKGQHSTSNIRMKKVDEQGLPVRENPVYFDIYTFNGLERIRFDAGTNSPTYMHLVNIRTDEGQFYQAADLGLEYIYDEEKVIRQVLTPTRLADIVTFNEFKYEVRYYKPDDIASSKNAAGLYEPLAGTEPFELWTVENPNGENSLYEINVVRTVGGTARTNAFTYSEIMNTWNLTKDGGETFNQSTMEWDESEINCVRTKSFYSAGQTPVSKQIKRIVKQPWGQALMEVEDLVSTTESRKRIFTYYSNPAETGRYSQIESIIEGDGSWQVRDYDSTGRPSMTVYSWKDVPLTSNPALAKAVYYDYTPHEASDVPLHFDERPRTVTETIEGIVTKKTYYTYKTNSSGAQIYIEERCVTQNASYGDTNNLKTVKTFYPPYSGTDQQQVLEQGRLKTEEIPGGLLKTYNYALGTVTADYVNPANASFTVNPNGFDWQVTVINGTVEYPAGIANKTTQNILVKDRYANDVLSETYVYSGAGYERVEWNVKQFDVLGHPVELYFSDGTQESRYWGSGCCGMDSTTLRDGTQYVYTYDLNGRMMSAVQLTTNGTFGKTIDYTYDAAGRKLGTSTYADGIVPLTTQTQFDMQGRPLWQQQENGTVKTWSYDDLNRIITAVQPGGATVITEKYIDGRVKQQTGTAKVHSAVDYGANSDGTWTTTYTGPNGTSSPVWEKKNYDLAGRLIKTEKPGFGGSTLITENVYRNDGKKDKTIQSALKNSAISVLKSEFF